MTDTEIIKRLKAAPGRTLGIDCFKKAQLKRLVDKDVVEVYTDPLGSIFSGHDARYVRLLKRKDQP